ncbi:hypothetical protein ABPG72_011205 [Tetrahymena utriculariae]
MNQIQSEASKNVQDAQSIKQTSSLFPQYQFKKNQQSPQKGAYQSDIYTSINPNTILSFNLQTNQAVQISLTSNDLKTPNIGKANNVVLGGNSYNNQATVQQYPSINAQYSFPSVKDSSIASSTQQKSGESNLKFEVIQSQQPQYNSLNAKGELNQTPLQTSNTQNPLVQQNNTNFNFSNQNAQGSNNFNQGSVNSVNFAKSPNSSNSTIGQSALQGNSSFFSNLGQQQQQNNQRASIEVSMGGANNTNGSKINSTNSANIQGGQQNQNLLYNTQSQSQTFSSNQGASSNNQTIIDTRTQMLGQGPGIGMISLDSSYTNLASNTMLGQSQGPQIVPSNQNLSIITPQDISNITNANYFNFQDLTLTSHQNSQTKTITNQNLNYNEQNILQNLKYNNGNNLQSNNMYPQSFSPAPQSVTNKQDYSYTNKQTSVTANNTPYKASFSTQSNTCKVEIKNPSQLNLQNDVYSKNFIQPAQSPGRLGLTSTKAGNSFAHTHLNQPVHNKISSNRHSQNQKSLNVNTTSSNASNIIGNSQQAGQLLPSQQQLVQSIVLQKNRSQSPNNLKSSKNFGQTSPSISKLGYQQNNFQQSINLSTNIGQTQYNYLLPNYLYNAANSSTTAIKKLPCKESQSPENRDKNLSSNNFSNSNSNQQFSITQLKPSINASQNYNNPQQQQQQVSQSSYYKVASQIRRNQLKERRPSALNSENSANTDLIQSVKCGSILGGFASSQLNINSSVNVGAVENPQQQLIYSQNYGKALPINEQQKQQYMQQQKELQQKVISPGTRRKNSTGSQGCKSQDKKDQKKRFTVVDKFNEKYTKKLIIDLCNYMNNSNDGQAKENNSKQADGQQIAQDEEDPIKRASSRKGNWQNNNNNNNNNMNMIEILSQQRVLQRSMSSQKRNILSHNNKSSDITGSNPTSSNTKQINLNNNHLTPSKSTQSASKRFSFRYTDKPWENTSFQNNSKFNSKYGSFSVMRSMNNSQSNWNLNGSQHLNSSINGEIIQKNIKISSNVQLNIEGKANSKKKNSSNFILEGFNDSQEISSSRNQNSKATHKSKNASDNINILNKNLGTDTKSFSVLNSTNKYKFQSTSNNHLSKPNTSSNAFQKQQQQSTINKKSNRGSAHIDPNNPKQKIKISSQINSLKQEKQTFSPQLSSQANSKNSTKSEIKKSQIINAVSASQINKNRFSENNYSQHASFDKAQEHEDQERDEEYVQDEDFDEDNHIEDFENEDEEDELEVHSQTDESNNSSKAIPIQGSNSLQHSSHDQGFTQVNQPMHQHHASNQDQQKPNTVTSQYQYNFESNLEQIFGVTLNIEELKKERQKLIRKITSTFKVKNKALSTSQEYYKVLHVIGKGAFAKVCLAVQLLTGKFVAIKLIDKSILRSESAKKRVLQEVQILKKLNNHKHVLKLLEVFENRKLIFIVTEYFKGQDLMKMMKERNGQPYTENQVRYMLTQIISGLTYIHGNMVLHRDIKLDNILVDSQLNLKIIDFGISRIIQKDQKMMEQCGTPAFLAPEIIANKGYEGFGSDLWSLGVLIYILLFGKVPFKGNNLTELHRNILNGVLPLDEMRETNVSQEAQDLLQKILKLKVKERINLEGIISSPWMKGYQIPEGIENKQLHYKQQQQQESYQNFDIQTSAGSSDQFDEKIIGQIEGFGYSREYILRCLNKGGLSHVNAIYKLIKNSNTNNNNNNNQNSFYS